MRLSFICVFLLPSNIPLVDVVLSLPFEKYPRGFPLLVVIDKELLCTFT
jgi:hypothetical protein